MRKGGWAQGSPTLHLTGCLEASEAHSWPLQLPRCFADQSHQGGEDCLALTSSATLRADRSCPGSPGLAPPVSRPCSSLPQLGLP